MRITGRYFTSFYTLFNLIYKVIILQILLKKCFMWKKRAVLNAEDLSFCIYDLQGINIRK